MAYFVTRKYRSLMKKWLFLLICMSFLSSIFFNISPFTDSSALTTWTVDNNTEFSNGSLENVIITPTGEVKLSSQNKTIQDDYKDESKIIESDNVTLDVGESKISLMREENTFFNSYGGIDNEGGGDVYQTNDGGYILVGIIGVNKNDVLLIKSNSNGIMQWNRSFGGSDYEEAFSVIQTTDGGYLIGGTTFSFSVGYSDMWLIKTDSTGNEQWNKTFGDHDRDWGKSVIQTSDGGYLFLGYTTLSGNQDITLIKTDSNGNLQWNKSYGGPEVEFAESFSKTSDGGYIIIGSANEKSGWQRYPNLLIIKIDNMGNEEWNSTPEGRDVQSGYSIQQTTDGGYIALGINTPEYTTKSQTLFIKINKTGNTTWKKIFNDGYYSCNGNSVIQVSDGGFIATGSSRPYPNKYRQLWLAKVNNSGDVEWEKNIGGEQTEAGQTVIQTTDNKYAIVGSTVSYSNGNENVLLMKINKKGEYIFEGHIRSNNLLTNGNSNAILSFDYDTEIYKNTKIEVQFSKDNDNWYSSDKIKDQWTLLQDKYNSIDLSQLNWNGNIFYYKLRISSYSTKLPSINFIQLNYSEYVTTGIYESEPFDNVNLTNWRELDWLEYTPGTTDIKLKLRTSKNLVDLTSKDYLGFDGSFSAYYEEPLTTIWEGHFLDRWIQFKAYLSTSDTSKTPTLQSVIISKNSIPLKPSLISPDNNTWINSKSLKFQWEYFDPENTNQYSYYWQADDEINFTVYEYDSDEQLSGAPIYVPPFDLEDGIWYWRVKVKDSDGDWSFFSNISVLKIDTEPPEIIHNPIKKAQEGEEIEISAEVMDEHSGVAEVLLYYKKGEDNVYTNANMSKNGNIYTTKIMVEYGTEEGMEYYFKAKDNSNPPNMIYFGISGEIENEPSAKDDINIEVTKQPIVLKNSPMGDNVSITADIDLTFSKAMSRQETMEAFVIYPEIDGKFVWKSDSRLKFDPLISFEYNTTYEVKITQSARYKNGDPFPKVHKWEFTTEVGNGTVTPPDTSNGDDKKGLDDMLVFSIIGIIILVIIILSSVIFIKGRKKSKEQTIFEQSKAVKPVVAHPTQLPQAQYPQMVQSQGVMYQPSPVVQPLQQPLPSPQPQTQQVRLQMPAQFSSPQLPPAPQPQQNLCQICGNALTFYPQNGKYYCYSCKRYQ